MDDNKLNQARKNLQLAVSEFFTLEGVEINDEREKEITELLVSSIQQEVKEQSSHDSNLSMRPKP